MIRWERGEDNRYGLCTMVLGRPHFPNYTYIVSGDDGDAIVIDPGYSAELIRLEMACHRLHLRAILLTHGHSDHVAATSALSAPDSVPVYLLEGEQLDTGFDIPSLTRCGHDRVLQAGSIEITPIATPGHSSGSACYLIGDFLFTGDTVFIEACGDCSGSSGSIDAMFDSLSMLKQRIASHVRVFPGHRYRAGPGVRFGDVVRLNIYFRLEQRAAFAAWYRRSAIGMDKEFCRHAAP